MVIWIIGISGAGKTTVGKKLLNKFLKNGKPFIFIDGDEFREAMGNDLGYTLSDREKNGKRISRLCKFLNDQDINVIVSILSIFEEHQQWNRLYIKKYFEIYLDVDMDTIKKRNQKNLYQKKDIEKNIVGRSIEFRPPKNPDLIISNNDTNQINSVVEDIYKKIIT